MENVKSLDELIHQVANDINTPEYYPEADARRIIDVLNEMLEELKDDEENEEYYSILEDIRDIFEHLNVAQFNFDKDKLHEFLIHHINWDNWESNEENEERDKKYFTVGGVYYSKLQWIIEGCTNEDVAEKAGLLQNTLPDFLNALEEYVNEN